MKRKLLVIGMGLVLVVSLASVAGAVFGIGGGVGDFCNANNNFGFGSHDTCVVCLNKGNNAHTCVCKIFEDQGSLGMFGFSNFGACVRTFAMM
jgi:hypothetical protein